jgi:uncharacterized protein (DUF1501 family)
MASLLGTGVHLHAAPATQNRFLLVFLRGGYDACNLLVPTSSNFYYASDNCGSQTRCSQPAKRYHA